jgi:hypothetical protein
LRRGKSNINWIKIMRSTTLILSSIELLTVYTALEGREFEDRMLNDTDPYVGTKVAFDDLFDKPVIVQFYSL